MQLALTRPATQYRESFLRALGEFRHEGLPWWLGDHTELAITDFAAFVALRLADPNKTHLWAIAGEDFIGRIGIHHTLTDALRIEGGHIGYDTVPSFRGRGVAREMLRQALPYARALGLDEVLLTCDDTNVASIRVIEKNGGVLRETKLLAPSRPPKRYYAITL